MKPWPTKSKGDFTPCFYCGCEGALHGAQTIYVQSVVDTMENSVKPQLVQANFRLCWLCAFLYQGGKNRKFARELSTMAAHQAMKGGGSL